MIMAKKNNDNNTGKIGAAIIGTVFGAALSQPSDQEKKEIQEYRKNKPEFINYQSRKQQFFTFLANEGMFNQFIIKDHEYNERFRRLRKLKKGHTLAKDQIALELFKETVRAYSNGLTRLTIVSCGILLEHIIKKHNPKRISFNERIEALKAQNIIDKKDYHFLHGLREERNYNVHDLPEKVELKDAEITINLTIKIMDSLL